MNYIFSLSVVCNINNAHLLMKKFFSLFFSENVTYYIMYIDESEDNTLDFIFFFEKKKAGSAYIKKLSKCFEVFLRTFPPENLSIKKPKKKTNSLFASASENDILYGKKTYLPYVELHGYYYIPSIWVPISSICFKQFSNIVIDNEKLFMIYLNTCVRLVQVSKDRNYWLMHFERIYEEGMETNYSFFNTDQKNILECKYKTQDQFDGIEELGDIVAYIENFLDTEIKGNTLELNQYYMSYILNTLKKIFGIRMSDYLLADMCANKLLQ